MRILGEGLLLAALVAFGCVQSAVTPCADGRVCPAGLACDEVHDRCVTPAQLEVCAGANDGQSCTLHGAEGGVCEGGVCVESRCGDGVVVGIERCESDDQGGITDCRQLGYYEAGAVGCTPHCTYDESACTRTCGDFVLDPEEQCDRPAGERVRDCTELGFYEPGDVRCGSCLFDTSSCAGRCGDGLVNGEEICDGGPPLSGCFDFGYQRGRAGCDTSSCAPELSNCGRIGWSELAGALGTWTTAFSPGAGDLLLAGGTPPRTVVRISNGSSTLTTLPGSGQAIAGLWGATASDVHAVTIDGGIFRFAAGTWTQSHAPGALATGLTAIAGASASETFAVGAGEQVLQWNGVGWTSVHSGTNGLNDVWVDASGAGYAVGNTGTILRRDGSAWSAETSNTTATLHAVWASSATNAWAVGANGTFLHRDATGWSTVSVPTTGVVTDVWGRAADDVYALVLESSTGVLLHYDGATWWRLVLGSHPGSVLEVIGNAAETFVLTDRIALRGDGATWSPAEIPPSASTVFYQDIAGGGSTLAALAKCKLLVRGVGAWIDANAPCNNPSSFDGYKAVWVGPVGEIFAAEDDGTVNRYNGLSWTRDPAGSGGTDVSSLWGTAANDVWSVNYSPARAVHWNGSTWTSYTLADNLRSVFGSSANDVYAVGGGIFRWGGTAWTEVTPNGWFGFLQDVWASGPADVWAVGSDGMIMHFDGTSWSQMPSGTAVSLNAIGGTGPSDVWAVGLAGTLLHYDGSAWSPVQPGIEGDFYDVVVRNDLVLLAAWHKGLVALVREAGW